MRVIPFDKQPLEDRCLDLDGPNIHPNSYPGQDSTVFRNNNDCAIHVYGICIKLDRVLAYAQCVNTAASYLDTHPFMEKTKFEGESYDVVVRVNPVEEVGENSFVIQGKESKHVYSLSPFIAEPSLCWPQQANDEEQRSVARCFNMLFYDRVDEYIDSQTGIWGVDINPVNVKYTVDRNQKKILLVITDLAKNIGDVSPERPEFLDRCLG